jgi:hypothetical protein
VVDLALSSVLVCPKKQPRADLLLVALSGPPALDRRDLADAPDFAGRELDLDVDHEGFARGSIRPPPGSASHTHGISKVRSAGLAGGC